MFIPECLLLLHTNKDEYTRELQNLRFSQWWRFKLSSVLWCWVILW